MDKSILYKEGDRILYKNDTLRAEGIVLEVNTTTTKHQVGMWKEGVWRQKMETSCRVSYKILLTKDYYPRTAYARELTLLSDEDNE